MGMLKDCELPSKVSKLNSTSSDQFGITFFLKDHKADLPLRAVVKEIGTWKKVVSFFLPNALSALEVSFRSSSFFMGDLVRSFRWI